VDPQLLRGGFRIAFLVLAIALVTLPFQTFGSAEFVVTVLALAVGASFALGIALLAHIASPPIPRDDRERKGYNGRSIQRGR
jgi:hypothetical protein